jgi:hypothetical protein
MGKKGANKKDKQQNNNQNQQPNVDENSKEEEVQHQQTLKESSNPQPAEVVMTPQEKTVAYRDMQLGVYMNFVKDFQEDEKMLVAEMELATNDSNTIPPERMKDLEKREREELKRLEKQVFRREIKEIEEAYASHNLKQLRDNMTKSINDCILKQQRAFAKVQAIYDEQQSICQKKRQDI